MRKKVAITSQDGHYRVVFRDFMGPYESKRIRERLGLKEVGADAVPSQPGECRGVDAMSRHPELHALLDGDSLKLLAEVVRDFHIDVEEGRDLLPAVEAIQSLEHRGSYVEEIERRHESAFARGPKAVAQAFLVRAIPAALVLGALFLAWRHFGDHHRPASLASMFVTADRPAVSQSWLAQLFDPDHSRELRTQLRGVRFLRDNRIILMDGLYLEVEGIDALRPVFDAAQKEQVAPVLDATASDGQVRIERLRVQGQDFMPQGGTLRKLAELGRTAERPRRDNRAASGAFRNVDDVAYDDEETLRALLGQRIALVGTIEPHAAGRLLRLDGGAAVLLARPSRGRVVDLLETFSGTDTELQVDLELKEVFPWKARSDKVSRGDTQIVGAATVHSASAQNYHVLARP